MRVVGEQNRDFGSADDVGPGLLQGLVDGRCGEPVEALRPIARFDVDRNFERRTSAQEDLSSLAVAPS